MVEKDIRGFIDKCKDKVYLNAVKNMPLEKCARNIRDVRFMYTQEFRQINSYYGHAEILKKYAGMDTRKPLDNCISIEHGTHYGEYVFDEEIKNGCKYILVQGSFREKLYKDRYGIDAISVGTIVSYAEPYYDEKKIEKLKAQNGRTLLVFPYHSTHFSEVSYEKADFLREIENISKDFDTVIVCMYWKDIILGLDDVYKKRGYKIVSAGHMFDIRFLSRMATILKLGDYLITNGIGDQVGQAIALDIPVYYYCQRISGDENVDKAFESKEYDMLKEIFCEYKESITKEQYDICNSIYGSKIKLSSNEMKEILSLK